MPKKKAVDAKSLIKMFEAEETQSDIMKKFGFKTSIQPKSSYMNALIDAGKVPEPNRKLRVWSPDFPYTENEGPTWLRFCRSAARM
jgi:hypothetical protein